VWDSKTGFTSSQARPEPELINFKIDRVTRLGKISPFGRFFMAKFFLEKIAQ